MHFTFTSRPFYKLMLESAFIRANCHDYFYIHKSISAIERSHKLSKQATFSVLSLVFSLSSQQISP